MTLSRFKNLKDILWNPTHKPKTKISTPTLIVDRDGNINMQPPFVDKDGKLNIQRVPIMITDHCINNCAFCSTKSVYLPPASYKAERFIPWLDKLLANDIEFSLIALTGGEPFLHEDIGRLIDELKNYYPSKIIAADTNFFWGMEEGLAWYLPRLKNLDILRISLYPHILKRLGGAEMVNQRIEAIKKALPTLKSVIVNPVHFFVKWEFHKERTSVKGPCGTSDCYVLLANGKMHRCSIATHLKDYPFYEGYSHAQAIFDLSGDIAGFSEFIKRYPFDLCGHCTFWKGEQVTWRGGVNTKNGMTNEKIFWERIKGDKDAIKKHKEVGNEI